MHSLPKRIILEKEVGETPLETLQAFRKERPEYADVSLCYAGRLDPMASGKLLVLVGDECKRQEKYHALDKQYEIEVLLDLSTDTGDVLGIPCYSGIVSKPDAANVKEVLRTQTGIHTVPYPAFSSKTVNGKPLFLHALSGTLNDIEIPTHEERIYRIQLLKREEVSKEVLQERIRSSLSKVPRSTEPSKELGADFRQDAIRDAWEELFEGMPNRSFTVLRLRVSCASGTYMRTLAERIGNDLGTRALALSIHRRKIGRYFGLGIIDFI